MGEKQTRIYRQRDLTAPLDVLTESQSKVLALLARYRYMTIMQMQRCGVSRNINAIRNNVLYRLTKRASGNLVQCQTYFATNTKFGRLPYVYALTKHGADAVAELFGHENVRYPIGKIGYVNDYFHREAYIDFCIAVDAWANADEAREVLEFSHYFDKTGANRKGIPLRSVNRLLASPEVGEIEPDGLFFVNTGSKNRAFAVEIHNHTDTKRIVQQLAKHTHAINSGVISRKFGHDAANFVLSVSMNADQSQLVKTRFLSVSGFERFFKLFVFSDMETIKKSGLEKVFTHADGAKAPIF